MTQNPTLLRPSTASALEVIGEQLWHESLDETVGTLLEYLAQQAARDAVRDRLAGPDADGGR